MNQSTKHAAIEPPQLDPIKLTFLRASTRIGKTLQKTNDGWTKASGDILVAEWRASVETVADINSLRRKLSQKKPNTILVQSEIRDYNVLAVDRLYRRNSETLAPADSRLLIFDFDKFETTESDPATCAALIRAAMPAQFRDVACVFNATASFGLVPGVARIRLFFIGDKALSLGQMKAWAATFDIAVDPSIYRPTQPIFLAAPGLMNAKGVLSRTLQDPVSKRWGSLDGEPLVAIPEDLPRVDLKTHDRQKEAAPDAKLDDPEMVGRFVREHLAQRDAKRVANDGRRNSIRMAAVDAGDLGLSQSTTSAIINLWHAPEDESAREACAERLTEIECNDVDKLVDQISEHGVKVGEAWSGEPIDDLIEDQIDDGYRGRQTAIGSKYGPDVSSNFAPVDESDDPLDVFRDTLRLGEDFTAAAEAVDAAFAASGVSATTRRQVRDVLETAFIDDEVDSALDRARSILESEAPARESKRRMSVTLRDMLAEGPHVPTWLLKGFLPLNVSAMLWGLPGSLKSTGISSVGFSMATQTPWIDGQTLRYGGFLYCAMESADHTRNMFHGFAVQHAANLDQSQDFPLIVHEEALTLYDPRGAITVGEKKIIKLAKAFESRFGVSCSLIVLDTLSRIMIGGNENLPADVAIVSAAVERIRAATGATVVVLHHATKDGDTMRGSGALTGNFEGVIRASREGDNGKLAVTRLKGVRAGSEIKYRSEEVEIAKYADGSPMNTFILRKRDPSSAFADVESEDDKSALEASQAADDGPSRPRDREILEIAKGFGRPFSRTQITDAYNARHKKNAVSEDTVWRALKRLKGGYLTLIDTGKPSDWLWSVIETDNNPVEGEETAD